MNNHEFIYQIFFYLLTTIICVSISRKIGFGSVLGYLIGGILIGPWGLGFIKNTSDITEFSEFGVAMLLFLIGLELNPKNLWQLRRSIFGLGLSQIIISTVVIGFIVHIFFKQNIESSFVIGFGLSLSSTAIAMQILNEKNYTKTQGGQAAFSILLFQDLAVIPILSLLPLLVINNVQTNSESGYITTLKAFGAILIIIILGRFLIKPAFRIIANLRSREIFVAFSLFLIFSIVLLMKSAHLSIGLGAFLSGVLLAESEYRHELESNLEPFKGLLLGLFFVSVGMGLDFGLMLKIPFIICSCILSLVLLKIILIYAITRINKVRLCQSILVAFLLSQGGEFGFVLFSKATDLKIIPPHILNIINVTLAFSMLTTPFLYLLFEKVLLKRFTKLEPDLKQDIIPMHDHPVIIAGFGRFGQVVARLLLAQKIKMTLIDHSPELIQRMEKFGMKTYYGDVTNIDLLETAGIEKAKLFILAIDDKEASLKVAEILQKKFPHLTILARAWDVIHLYEFFDRNIKHVERETFDSALSLGQKALTLLGMRNYPAYRAAMKFKEHNSVMIEKLYKVRHDQQQFVRSAVEIREELEKVFTEDEEYLKMHLSGEGWG